MPTQAPRCVVLGIVLVLAEVIADIAVPTHTCRPVVAGFGVLSAGPGHCQPWLRWQYLRDWIPWRWRMWAVAKGIDVSSFEIRGWWIANSPGLLLHLDHVQIKKCTKARGVPRLYTETLFDTSWKKCGGSCHLSVFSHDLTNRSWVPPDQVACYQRVSVLFILLKYWVLSHLKHPCHMHGIAWHLAWRSGLSSFIATLCSASWG